MFTTTQFLMLMKRKIAFNKLIQLMSKNVQNTRKLLINFTDFFSFFPPRDDYYWTWGTSLYPKK